MITILHGDDLKSSRNVYTQLKQDASGYITLEGSSIDTTSLTQALSGDGLFDDNKVIFIELLLTKKKKSHELDELLLLLNSFSEKEIVLWESKEIDKKTLTSLPKAAVRVFKLPQLLFSFVDSLKPNNSSHLIPLFHQIIETVEVEIVFAMIVRQFRLLLALKGATTTPIDEIKRIAPWQEQKLKKQSLHFTEENLVSNYTDLFEIDHAQKTGKLPNSLSTAIDIWLFKL